MALFPRRKECKVTFVDQYIVIVGKDRYHHHDHELQEIKSMLKKILKKIEPPVGDDPGGKLKQEIFDTLNKAIVDIKSTV